MPIADRLGHRDYDAALALITDAAQTSGTQPFELPAIERLLRVIPAERAGYFEYTGRGVCLGTPNSFFVEQPSLPKQPLDWASDGVREAVASWPLQDIPQVPELPYGSPLKLSDFLTGRRLQRNLFYASIMRPGGLEHELKVWLPAPNGIYRGFFLVRSRRQQDFDERDRALLAFVRPHLARIRARWERRHRPPILTKRESEVVGLVAEGLTNGEIAARLVLSPATVRKHLENVFEKLGVHTRTAAVARLHRAVDVE